MLNFKVCSFFFFYLKRLSYLSSVLENKIQVRVGSTLFLLIVISIPLIISILLISSKLEDRINL